MDWVTENIAIGNFLDARSSLTGQVDAVLCLNENCCDEADSHIDLLCVPMVDGPGNNPKAIDQAVDFIDAVVSSDGKILVHCHAGRSRSVCVVARYLMAAHRMTRHQALEAIARKREIFLSPGIEEILEIKS